jgi:hypothetical protein
MVFDIKGDTLMINRFNSRGPIKDQLEELDDEEESANTEEGGEPKRESNKKKVKKVRNYAEECESSKHVSTDGWEGVNASAFRNALISACRVCGLQMTKAKLSLFCLPDGIGLDGTPLVRILGSEAKMDVRTARNANARGKSTIVARPRYDNWKMKVRISFDQGQFSDQDVYNLMMRAGYQVGICVGRPDSKDSAGMGMGTFVITNAESSVYAL